MLNSFVTLFWRTDLFTEATDWMRRHGYTVVSLDASGWADDEDPHRDIAAALDFPAYYGRNLDALNDCLHDVVDYEYGTTREATGLLIAFTGYDIFTRRRPRTAQMVLDIMARQARSAMLGVSGHGANLSCTGRGRRWLSRPSRCCRSASRRCPTPCTVARNAVWCTSSAPPGTP